MRRALLVVLALVIGFVVAVAGGLASQATFPRVYPHLPGWLQTQPSLYLRAALNVVREQAARRDAVDWPAVKTRAEELAKDARSAADTYPAIRHVLEQLKDGHSSILPATPGGPPGAYGLQTLFPDRVVAVVYPGSVAAAAGILAGDVIELVNGEVPAASQDPRARGYFVNIPPPSATLRLRRPGAKETRDVQLRIGPYVPLPAIARRLGTNVGYVLVPGTSGQDQFAERVRESIAQADAPARCGWIVDLRFNNGGSLWAILQTLRPILGEAPIGAFVPASGERTPWAYPTSGMFGLPKPEPPLANPGGPIAVLTSRLTANSGEVAAIAFRGRPNTRSFGEPTWGGPTENTPFRLADGALLDLATSLAADRTGKVYEGRIAPDQPVAIDWAKLTAEDDPVIVAASTWVRSVCGSRK